MSALHPIAKASPKNPQHRTELTAGFLPSSTAEIGMGQEITSPKTNGLHKSIGTVARLQPAAANVVSINSPTVARALLAELILHPDMVSGAMKKVLANAEISDRNLVAAIERMTIWADLSGLIIHSLSQEETQWRQAAVSYCIIRQAHYALLKKLFKVSREEVSKIRQDLGSEV